jgi:molecular chaperone DnaJ
MSDHYQTLGVAKNASPDEIKKAYRRMAGIHHPDKGGDTATFQKVQEAYETLSDPQKKQQYDNPNPFGPGGMHGGMHSGFPGGFQFHMNGFDINDIFGQMFGGGGFQGRPQQPSYRTTVWVSMEQVFNGGEQVLQMQGQKQTIKIQIPRGVDDGQTMRYDNLIPNGILIVEFRIYPNAKYQRNGLNLHSVHEIDILDLIVGGTFKFKVISGKELDVTVKPNTQPGAQLLLSGEGLPGNNIFGDQMILLKPFISDKIDSRIIDAIKQYR